MFPVIDKNKILKDLQTRVLGRKITLCESISSTNDAAWEYSNSADSNGLVVIAESQHSGRGRRSRRWMSDSGKSILCSFVLKSSQIETELLTIAIAISIAETIFETCSVTARIKWPNDILVNGKKIAGILIETRQAGSTLDYVIGIGINCHQTDQSFSGIALDKIATSLDIATGKVSDRNQILCSMLKKIEIWLDTAINDSSRVIERWRLLSSQIGRRIEIECNNSIFAGNCIDVDPTKGLVMQLDTGGVRMFHASQSTIVKNDLL